MIEHHPLADRIVRLYDETVAASKEGRQYGEVIEQIAPDVATLLDDIPRNVTTEAKRLIAAVLGPVRRQRRRSIGDQLDYILDSLFTSHDDDVADLDPLLDVAYGLGSSKGDDKALRYWTVEDFRELVQTAYRNGSDVTAAARDLDDRVQRVIDAMTFRGADTLGDLDDDEDDA